MNKSKNQEMQTVGSLEPKSVFKYGGISWIVLDNKGENGVLCLAEKSLFNKAFDDDNCNNWEQSSLREYLNNDFLKRMIFNDDAVKIDFIPIVTDLTADDGLKDYGTCVDTISLISCQQYRQYRGIIPNLDNWWWTCTAYSTKTNGYSCGVRTVYSDGALDDISACDVKSVRPICTLQSETLVSDIKNAKNNIKSAIAEIKNCTSNTLNTTITAVTSELAIQALEKQILKKVVPLTMHNKKLISGWKCISCEARLWVGRIYCPNCGQKLDWDTGEK